MSKQYPGLLTTPETRLAFRQEFAAKANARTLTALDMAQRALLLGYPLERAFTPITNTRKLNNGADAHASIRATLYTLTCSGLQDGYLAAFPQEIRKEACDATKRAAQSADRALPSRW